jgi:hypothetical protein
MAVAVSRTEEAILEKMLPPIEKTVPVWVKENGDLESTLSRWRKEAWLNPDYSNESVSQIAEKTAQDNAATTDNGPLVGNPVVSCSPTDRPRQMIRGFRKRRFCSYESTDIMS